MADRFTLTQRQGLGLATVMVRKGVVASQIGKALDVSLEDRPCLFYNDGLVLIGTGPGTWLAIDHTDDPDWPGSLSVNLSGLASVSDQSGGYVLFRLSGPNARDVLQREIFIDLDPGVFVVGSVAVTTMAHMGVILWRPSADAYEIAVFRSYVESFLSVFGQSLAAT